MRTKAAVFVSSAFEGNMRARQKIKKILSDLGYTAILYEDRYKEDSKIHGRRITSRAFSLIEECDAYLGINAARWGSPWRGLSFTEYEYYFAASRLMPSLLYRIIAPTQQSIHQTANQNSFISVLEDPGISPHRPHHVGSWDDVYHAIRIDLPNLSLRQRRPPLLAAVGIGRQSQSKIGIGSAREHVSDNEVWTMRMMDLEAAKDVSLSEAVQVGLVHLHDSLAEIDLSNKMALDGLNEYLSRWHYVSAWSGLPGPLSQTGISRLQFILAQYRRHFADMVQIAGGISSGYYSERKLDLAEKWYAFYRRNGPIPELEGPIALARGNFGLACRCFEAVLKKKHLSGESKALHEGYLASALAKNGSSSKVVLNHLKSAWSDRNIPPRTATRVWRSCALALDEIGDHDAALYAFAEAERVANHSGLVGQVRKAKNAAVQVSTGMSIQ